MSSTELGRALWTFGIGLLLPLPVIAVATYWGPVQYALLTSGSGLIICGWWLGRSFGRNGNGERAPPGQVP